MLATSYSFLPKALPGGVLRRLAMLILVAVTGVSFAISTAQGQTNHLAGPAEFAAYARNAFEAARKHLMENPTNSIVLTEYARTGFDRGEFATNDTERAALAEECIVVCRGWISREPNSASAHYYLGMNLGQLARTKSVGALKIVDEMEREFKASARLDEHLDNAGSDRNLGLLYLEAPSFFSIGNRSKARHHLQRAIELAPNFPENHLNYLEACLRWSDRAGAQKELKQLDDLLPVARKYFTGPMWDSSWADWQKRLDKAREQMEAEPQKTGKQR